MGAVLAYITGMNDQELLLRNEYKAQETFLSIGLSMILTAYSAVANRSR